MVCDGVLSPEPTRFETRAIELVSLDSFGGKLVLAYLGW